MKKLIFAFVILMVIQIGTASADRLSQIMFPMDFIESGSFDSTLFSIEDLDGQPDILAVKIRGNDFTDDTLWLLPIGSGDTPYVRRGEISGMPITKDGITKQEAIESFVEFCGKDILVSFDAFDEGLPALLAAADDCGIMITNRCVDLTWLARIYIQALPSYSFNTLCRATNNPVDRLYMPDVAVALMKTAREIYYYNFSASQTVGESLYK